MSSIGLPPLDPAAPLADLVEAQVRRTPDRTALIDGGSRLTYRELWSAVQQLASALADAGVRAETLVESVCPERPTWWSPSWRCSGRAERTYRWTRPTRGTGWNW